MPRQGDNQHTTPAFTEAELVERFRKLLLSVDDRAPDAKTKDWPALFIEWIRSSVTEYKTITSFCRAKGIAYATIQNRGGSEFWKRARKSVHAKAVAIAVERAPQEMARKYEKQLRIVGKMEDAIEHSVDRLREQQLHEKMKRDALRAEGKEAPVDPLAVPMEVPVLEALIDAMDKLAKTNVLLDTDGVQRHEVRTLNLHARVEDALRQRDQEYGVGG